MEEVQRRARENILAQNREIEAARQRAARLEREAVWEFTDYLQQEGTQSATQPQAQHSPFTPETERVAQTFYVSLMTMIQHEFGHQEPLWQNLDWKEKKLWLQAANVLLEELRKTPVQVSVAPGQRIIQTTEGD